MTVGVHLEASSMPAVAMDDVVEGRPRERTATITKDKDASVEGGPQSCGDLKGGPAWF